MRGWVIIVALMTMGISHFCYGQGVSIAQTAGRDTVNFHQSIKPSFTSATFSGSQQQLLPVKDNFYATHLSFFCTQEIKLEQVHVPLIFRVGSVENSNYLEQKTGATIR